MKEQLATIRAAALEAFASARDSARFTLIVLFPSFMVQLVIAITFLSLPQKNRLVRSSLYASSTGGVRFCFFILMSGM